MLARKKKKVLRIAEAEDGDDGFVLPKDATSASFPRSNDVTCPTASLAYGPLISSSRSQHIITNTSTSITSTYCHTSTYCQTSNLQPACSPKGKSTPGRLILLSHDARDPALNEVTRLTP